jgi:paraquat-inducible protein B
MPKRASSKAIGAFVMASLAVVAVAIVILGSGRLFARPHYYICMFQGNINGLKVGAAVKVKGVQIGTVSHIGLRLAPSQGRLKQVSLGLLPVIIVLNERQVEEKGGPPAVLEPEEFHKMIDQGLRAKLAMESLLTGVLYIDLSIHPNSPAQYFIQPGSGPYIEIPTLPTDFEQIKENATRALAKLEKIDFNRLVASITDASQAVEKLAGDPALLQAIDSANRLIGNPNLQQAIDRLDNTIGNVNGAVIAVKKTVERSGQELDPLIASLRQSSGDLHPTLVQARSTLASAQLILRPDSPVLHRLDSTLDGLTEASRSIHDLADYLERNPSALIRGKYISRNSE